MAEIYVERKKRSPLLWIILVIAILAIIGYFVWAQNNVDRNAPAAPAPADTVQPAPVQPAT